MTSKQKRIVFILLIIVLGLVGLYFSQDLYKNFFEGSQGEQYELEDVKPLSAEEIQKALQARYAAMASSSVRLADQEKKAEEIQKALESKPSAPRTSQTKPWSYENYPSKNSSSLSAAEIQKSLDSKNNE